MEKKKRSVVLVWGLLNWALNIKYAKKVICFLKIKKKSRIYTFLQSNELGRLYSYSGHTILIQIDFTFCEHLRAYVILICIQHQISVCLDELDFWNHSIVIGNWTWIS